MHCTQNEPDSNSYTALYLHGHQLEELLLPGHEDEEEDDGDERRHHHQQPAEQSGVRVPAVDTVPREGVVMASRVGECGVGMG